MTEVTTLGALAASGRLEFNDGYRTKLSEQSTSGFPILRVAEVLDGRIEPTFADRVREEYRGQIGSKISRPGDVVVTTKGTVGRVVRMPANTPEFVYSPQLCFFRPMRASGIDGAFLYMWFRGSEFRQQAAGVKSQTDMADYINLADLRGFRITLPDLLDQKSIVEVLGPLDDKIESDRRLITILADVIGASYARATADRSPEHVDKTMAVEMGAPFAGAQFAVPGVGRPLIRIRDLKTFQPQVWTRERRPDELVVKPGDVVVGMDAEFRSTFWLGPEGVLNQRLCRFRPRAGVGRAYALHAIRGDLAFFEGAKTGTTVIHLNKADIDKFGSTALSTQEHTAFAEATEPLVDRLVVAAGESRTLATLRDALLPELLSGRIRVAS